MVYVKITAWVRLGNYCTAAHEVLDGGGSPYNPKRNIINWYKPCCVENAVFSLHSSKREICYLLKSSVKKKQGPGQSRRLSTLRMRWPVKSWNPDRASESHLTLVPARWVHHCFHGFAFSLGGDASYYTQSHWRLSPFADVRGLRASSLYPLLYYTRLTVD